tara:strand:+ start:32 stop:652 length:621 start_codon:yes stop_codon:yes gene_type:complete
VKKKEKSPNRERRSEFKSRNEGQPYQYTSETKPSQSTDYAFTDLGSALLKKQHRMKVELLEDRRSLRAKVLDQRIFDTLYLQDEIDDHQFNVCEKFLELAHRAGIFPSNPVWESFRTGVISGGQQNNISRNNFSMGKSVMLLGVDRYLSKKGGDKIRVIVWNVVVENRSPIKSQMDSLRIGLNLLDDYWFPVLTRRSNSSSINNTN